MRQIWDRDFAQSVDLLTQTQAGIAEETLMHAAGQAVVDELAPTLSKADPILVLCGPGNNGGDGFVCALLLHQLRFEVYACLISDDPDKLSSSCRREWQRARAQKLLVDFKTLDRNRSWIVVDAILGIGLRGELRAGPIRETLTQLHQFNCKKVIAVDIPSGLNCDGENCEFIGLPANTTITFGGSKPAHRIYPWRQYCGAVIVKDIGFAREAILRSESLCQEKFQPMPDLDPKLAFAHLALDAHKFERGHLLIIGGSPGKNGAPVLAAKAALRAGAGWVSIASPEVHAATPIEVTREVFFRDNKVDCAALKEFINQRKVKGLLLGPGTTSQFITKDLAKLLAEFSDGGGKICFDAAATSHLSAVFSEISLRENSSFALPHPGEWQRAVDFKFNFASETHGQWLDFVKHTGIRLIFKSSTPTWPTISGWMYTDRGHRVLGKAGTGDVLAGLVAAYLMHNAELALQYALNDFYRATYQALQHRDEKSIIPTDIINEL